VVKNLNSGAVVPVRLSYTITRNPPNDDNSGDIAAVVTGERTVNITEDIRQKLIKALNGSIDEQTTTYDLHEIIEKID
jgi:hypothetical protein